MIKILKAIGIGLGVATVTSALFALLIWAMISISKVIEHFTDSSFLIFMGPLFLLYVVGFSIGGYFLLDEKE